MSPGSARANPGIDAVAMLSRVSLRVP